MRKIVLFLIVLALLTVGACVACQGVTEPAAVNDAADAYIHYCD